MIPLPRLPRPPALALLLLAAALAGCAAPPPAEEPAPAREEQAAEPGLVPSQEAANATQPEEQSEFARSLDEKFHTHNYWGASLEKVLMDQDVSAAEAAPVDPANPFFTVFRLAFRLGFGGAGLTPFEMPEGSIVPPEANRVEVAVTWAASPTITGLRLGYMNALSKDIEVLEEPFPAGGGTVTIATDLTRNDMPHTTVSKWRFLLIPYNPQGGPGVFNGTVHVTIKAFRDDTLFIAAPHPDFWGDATRLPLAQVNGTLKGTRVIFPIFVADQDGITVAELPNGTIIPPHTGVLTVTLTWANDAGTPDPFGTRPDLAYAPANTRRPFQPEQQRAEPGQAVYTIPVDPRMVDSPYANASEWVFYLFVTSDAPTEQGFFGFGSVGTFEGTWSLTIEAEREVV